LLGEATDGGEALNSTLWHPLRPPTYHSIVGASALFRQISDAFEAVITSGPVPETDWYRIEIERLLKIFRHATDQGEGIISALQQPADRKRASRVHIPLRFGWRWVLWGKS
jgi:hypothetical protein